MFVSIKQIPLHILFLMASLKEPFLPFLYNFFTAASPLSNECETATLADDAAIFVLLTYLCGTTTNIWLRPVQEDLSMTTHDP
jgi:hypothetical protein